MKLPQTYVLTPAEVREAFTDWVFKINPFTYLQIVHCTVAYHSDGSVTVTIDHPVPDIPPPETA